MDEEEDGDNFALTASELVTELTEAGLRHRAEGIYQHYATQYRRRFKWLPSALFQKRLATHLEKDALSLLRVMQDCGEWNAGEDVKLERLLELGESDVFRTRNAGSGR